MKKLGIIGGADPAASCLLYRRIIDRCLVQGYCTNGSDFPEIVLINYPFSRGLSSRDADENKRTLITQLQYCIDQLTKHGVDMLAIACNTLHGLLAYVDVSDKKLVHLVRVVTAHAAQQKKKKFLLFGTPTTIHHRIYHDYGISIITPDQQNQKIVDAVIANIHGGVISAHDAQRLIHVAQNMYEQGSFEGIILGCTDLSVLNDRYPFRVTMHNTVLEPLDSIDILSRVLVEEVFKKNINDEGN